MSRQSDRQRRKAKKLRQERKRHTTVISSRLEQPKQFEYRTWPIIKAYSPDPDCFRATGHGTAGVSRERPDGQLVTSFIHISLLDGGILAALGKDETDLKEVQDLFDSLKFKLPPMVESMPELTSRYVWGAYAWGLEDGYEWDGEMRDRYLAMIPSLSGRSTWWLQQFLAGDDVLVPGQLTEMIRQMDVPDDLPEGKEIMILTRATFSLADAPAALSALRRRDPEFIEEAPGEDDPEDVAFFDWTRKYPKNHWSPLSLLGGRQSLGSVEVTTNTLIAETKTLSMAAVLISKLKDAFGDLIRLTDTEWKSSDELIREAHDEVSANDEDDADEL